MEMQRAVGRIEGRLTEITDKLNAMIVNHIQHENDDRRDFGELRRLIAEEIKQQREAVASTLADQDKQIAGMKEEQDRAKGAGWAILAMLGALASFVGAAVISVFTGHISIKWS